MDQTGAINKAFSKQALRYDEEDRNNPILKDLRIQVYDHVNKFLPPNSYILELNAGTGIDAMHFANSGHQVLATDLSDGMIQQIEKKITANGIGSKIVCRQLSYDKLDEFVGYSFDYVFSNFGGLNCIDDLSKVSRHIPNLIKPQSHVTLVIMPPVCPWELMGVLKGHGKKAFRRFSRNGAVSHLEGEYFKTYYYNLSEIREAMGPLFKLVSAEGLGALSPPPHRSDFPVHYKNFYAVLRKVDSLVRTTFPFNRWADHIITTFQYNP